MSQGATRSRYLKALLLKESGHSEEAFEIFERVQSEARTGADSALVSFALSNCAQIRGSQRRFAEALTMARKAFAVAETSGLIGTIAMAQGTLGEVLRDLGDLESSIRAYAACVSSYEATGMDSFAAYTRVLLAETLLLMGRPREAASEIVAALPTIEVHWLGLEASAAIALLRQAIHQQQSDPDSLRLLREQLQQMHREGKL